MQDWFHDRCIHIDASTVENDEFYCKDCVQECTYLQHYKSIDLNVSKLSIDSNINSSVLLDTSVNFEGDLNNSSIQSDENDSNKKRKLNESTECLIKEFKMSISKFNLIL